MTRLKLLVTSLFLLSTLGAFADNLPPNTFAEVHVHLSVGGIPVSDSYLRYDDWGNLVLSHATPGPKPFHYGSIGQGQAFQLCQVLTRIPNQAISEKIEVDNVFAFDAVVTYRIRAGHEQVIGQAIYRKGEKKGTLTLIPGDPISHDFVEASTKDYFAALEAWKKHPAQPEDVEPRDPMAGTEKLEQEPLPFPTPKN